ncbi:hypothetical protein IEQ34_002291 [Dendrobium chrysotoxum]|uniref:Uncharacterized protein n=1 Tax=Dendrobium chrysotoxum TaxID=161865 RepID=A0AAV7HLG1_DENCH|nr:hypothetical protein IEQ34_002291 [Dendrobium chrysotoxum]
MEGIDRPPIIPSDHADGGSSSVTSSIQRRFSPGKPLVIRDVSPVLTPLSSYEGKGKNVVEEITFRSSSLSKIDESYVFSANLDKEASSSAGSSLKVNIFFNAGLILNPPRKEDVKTGNESDEEEYTWLRESQAAAGEGSSAGSTEYSDYHTWSQVVGGMQHDRVYGLGSQAYTYEGQTSSGSNFSSSTQESLYIQQIAALTVELE